MKKVLIISSQADEQEMLQKASLAHKPGEYGFETTASFGQDVTFWTGQAPDVLIINLPDDDVLQGYYFTKLRKDVLKTQPIIFLCSAISAPLMHLSQHFTKIRMIKTPIEGNSLFRAVIDLSQNFQDGKRQISPRYLTEQAIEVMSDLHDGRMKAIMKNLSVTGAYFEALEKGFEIKADDFIRISVYAGEPIKLYVFDVRIVWARDKGDGLKCYGCTFVDKDAVYNNLLKHM